MSRLVDPIVGEISTNQEVTNAIWRASKKMTNLQYLKRRDVKFFEGSLGYFNVRENIYVSERNRDKKLKIKKKVPISPHVLTDNLEAANTGPLPSHIKSNP